MTPVVLRPGKVSLAEWNAVYRGTPVTVDPECRAAIRRSAEAVVRIVAKGEPVYGVNTGFGKLASVQIAMADLETLQRNIVLSHASGVGEPAPAPIADIAVDSGVAPRFETLRIVRPRPLREIVAAERLVERLHVAPHGGNAWPA